MAEHKTGEKLRHLKDILSEMGSVVVAYSGGVDSTFLLKVAHDTLGKRALGVIGKSDSLAISDLDEALRIASERGMQVRVIATEEMSDPNYVSNPENRCYFCKLDLFRRLGEIARESGIHWVVDGTNVDDASDTRPGRLAAEENNVRSPLCEAGLTKVEIRELSRQLGLPTWDKPEAACLASRIPHGMAVTPEILRQVEKSEAFLRLLGFRQVRVRHHGSIARVETPEEEMHLFFDSERRHKIVEGLKETGYRFVTVDLAGYRRGKTEESGREQENE